MLYEILIAPFYENQFMQYALLSIVYLSISLAPVGVFLVIRRMSLIGDALSHAILPGVAIGFIIAGFNLLVMSLMGLLTGFIMVFGSSIATKFSNIREDANFAGFYLTCLAFGVILVSKYGSSMDLLSFLFGSILAINKFDLYLIGFISSLTLLILAIIYRPLLIGSIEPSFLKIVKSADYVWFLVFQMLVVLNLVAGFQTLGTLMSVGLMIIPAVTAKLWFAKMASILIGSFCFALINGIIGLLLSYHFDIPSGSMIILCCGLFYLLSLIIGPSAGILFRQYRKN